MDPLTIIAIARAVIAGVSEAVAIWPVVEKMLDHNYVPDQHELDALDVAADIAHAALNK